MKRLLIASTIVLVLTGCASLPEAGPVRIGPDLSVVDDGESFYYSPSGPVDGLTQLEILNGFLSAGTGPQNDYAVAREYLSEEIRSSWNPSEEVLIQRSSAKVEIVAEETATVSVELAARVDADGKYESFPAGTNKTLEFSFVRENQQWRLSSAPNSTVLIRPVFDVVFRSYSVYFLDKQKRYLVPELRWFPTSAATGTKLANALLRGATSWLRPAVTSAIPSGTRLSIDAVTVEQGVALVDLTARALVAGRRDRALMKAQLEATLSQLPNVAEVAISIERSRQEITDPIGEVRPIDLESLLGQGPNGLELFGSGESNFFSAGNKFFELAKYSKLAASEQTGWLAAVTADGVVRTRLDEPGDTVELVASTSSVIGIEYDPQGYLWTASRSVQNQLRVFTQSSEVLLPKAPWLESYSVSGVSISPEGSRVALLVESGNNKKLLLSAVVRDQSGAPIELAAPIEIGADVFNPTAINWVGSMQLAAVATNSDITSIYLLVPGGNLSVLAGVSGSVQVRSQGANSPLYALTDGGTLYIFRGSSWSQVGQDIFNLTYVR